MTIVLELNGRTWTFRGAVPGSKKEISLFLALLGRPDEEQPRHTHTHTKTRKGSTRQLLHDKKPSKKKPSGKKIYKNQEQVRCKNRGEKNEMRFHFASLPHYGDKGVFIFKNSHRAQLTTRKKMKIAHVSIVTILKVAKNSRIRVQRKWPSCVREVTKREEIEIKNYTGTSKEIGVNESLRHS